MPTSTFLQPTVYKAATEESWHRHRYSALPYVHKWWARRLQVTSSVLITAALEDAGPPQGLVPVIYDPFMGMGSLVSAGLAAGCSVAAGDVNPVPYFAVQTALTPVDRHRLEEAFIHLLDQACQTFNPQWTVQTPDGPNPIRFALWVKVVLCPLCQTNVELFHERIIGAFVHDGGHLERYTVCPVCDQVDVVQGEEHLCSRCGQQYSLIRNVIGKAGMAVCPSCDYRFLPGIAARLAGGPREKLIAIAVGESNGTRRFITPTAEDIFHASGPIPEPRPLDYLILQGRTTEQVLAWGYRSWANLFTPRHLALLAHLAENIQNESDSVIRAWLATTVSTSLDFMSTLCSFRGPKFGAVRNATAHHILRPALISLENNPLGSRHFSGTLRRVFYTRVLPAVPDKPSLVARPANLPYESRQCYLYHGSSAEVRLPDQLVDAVVTDPPYFSKIFYQDLAQVYVAFLGTCGLIEDAITTMRETAENAVESEDSEIFRERLTAVWRRCLAVLRPGGVIAFSFRSSDPVVWVAMARSLADAGLACYRAEIAQAEATKTLTKAWARHPSTLDVMLFCKAAHKRPTRTFHDAWVCVRQRCETAERQLQALGHSVGEGDRLLINFGQWVVEATQHQLIDPDPWGRLRDDLSAVLTVRKTL